MHIAGVFYGNQLISAGFNQRKSHPFQKKFGRNDDSIYLHAEISAIYGAIKRVGVSEFHRYTLNVIRLYNGRLLNSKPCIGCNRCITTFGIRKVFHS